MELQPAEHIVVTSEPAYPALTHSEHLAIKRIRLRARSCRRTAPCKPVSERLARTWLTALFGLMALRTLLALSS